MNRAKQKHNRQTGLKLRSALDQAAKPLRQLVHVIDMSFDGYRTMPERIALVNIADSLESAIGWLEDFTAELLGEGSGDNE